MSNAEIVKTVHDSRLITLDMAVIIVNLLSCPSDLFNLIPQSFYFPIFSLKLLNFKLFLFSPTRIADGSTAARQVGLKSQLEWER